MEIASTEQPSNYPILREQFFVDSERGSMSTKLAVLAGTLFVAAGAVLGAGNYARHNPPIDKTNTISAGKGTVTSVSTFDVAESCIGVYKDRVTDASAEFNMKVTLPWLGKVGTSYSAKSTYNGEQTTEVCNKDMVLNFSYNKDTNKAELQVPGDAFSTTVYRTDPTVNAFTHRNGVLMMIQRNFENEINVLPKLAANKSDDLLGKLDGYAELAADQTSSEACGPKAWLYLEPLYEISLKKRLIGEANRWIPGNKLTLDDVSVSVTGKVNFTNQYADLLAKTKAQAGEHGVTFVLPDPNKLDCTVNSDLAKTLDKTTVAAP